MKHVTSTIAVCAGLAISASAQAGFAELWSMTVQYGTNNPWRVQDNPTSYQQTETTMPDGAIRYRVEMGWSATNWSAAWTVEYETGALASGGTRGAGSAFVSSSFTITNNSGILAPFTVTVDTPTAAIPGPNFMTGSVSGTVGDGNGTIDQFGNGASVMTQADNDPYYDARIDLAGGVRNLLSAPQFDSAPLGLTRNINLSGQPSDFIGEAAPAVGGFIGIRNSFMLTPGDNASFTSTFLVVPAPAGIGLAGLVGIAALRRRR